MNRAETPATAAASAGHAGSSGAAAGLLSLFRRRWLLISTWTVACTALAIWGILQIKPLYRAEAVLLLSTRTEHLSDLKSVVSGPLPAIPDPDVPRGEVDVLESRLLARQVIDKLGLENSPDLTPQPSLIGGVLARIRQRLGVPQAAPPPGADRRMTQTVDAYLKHLGAFNDGRSYTLDLSYEASDPELAARIANTHAELYLADQRDLKQRADEQAIAWLTQQVQRLDADLGAKQQAIRDLRERAGLVDSSGSTALERQVTDIGTSLAQARADVALRQARLDAARQGGNDSQAVIDSDLIHKLREQEAEAQQRVAALSQQFGGAYPPLTQARAQAADISAKIAQETTRILNGLRTDLATAQQREADLAASLANLQKQRDQQAGAAVELQNLQRSEHATESVYQILLDRLGEIRAQIGAEHADARLISPAAPPERPFFPNVTMFASVALMLSAGSGLGLAWLLERRHRGLTHLDALSELGLPALEVLPYVSARERRGRPLADLVMAEPKSFIAEQVRALRGDIAMTRDGDSPRVIALTSTLPGEGKTTTALLLARSMAASGLQVLLIECDLRRPSAMRQLRLKTGGQGLVAVLRDGASLSASGSDDPQSTMRVLSPEQEVTRPQDLLGGDALRRLIAEARQQYDYVLVDTPPLGTVSDAMLVAKHADWILLVVRWKVTPAAAIKAVLRKLARHDLQVAGAVLNAANMKSATPDGLSTLYRARLSYTRRSYNWVAER